MRGYVINLESRSDRWVHVQNQASKDGIHVTRVDAIKASNLTPEIKFVSKPPVAATWLSHQKAMRAFLDSDDNYGLIFEDDFLTKKGKLEILKLVVENQGFDFLQLGWIYPHYLDRFTCAVLNVQDAFFKFLSTINPKLIPKRISSKVSILEQLGVKREFVLHDIRAGAHAYLISRSFAKFCLTINDPIFLSADGVFMAIGVSRNFRMARSRFNLVGQSGSPSSINIKAQ